MKLEELSQDNWPQYATPENFTLGVYRLTEKIQLIESSDNQLVFELQHPEKNAVRLIYLEDFVAQIRKRLKSSKLNIRIVLNYIRQ